MRCTGLTFALSLIVTELAPYPVLAATQTALLSVTATVVSSCQISAHLTASTSYIAARAYPASPVSVICTMPTPYDVSYSAGAAPSVTVTTRKAASPEAALGTGNKTPPSDAISGQHAQALHDTPGTNADLITTTVTY